MHDTGVATVAQHWELNYQHFAQFYIVGTKLIVEN